ncbi:MAG: hypothetical protein AAF845_01745 [Bacteroidota bacterium]
MNVQPSSDPRASSPVVQTGGVQADGARQTPSPPAAPAAPEAASDRVEISAQGRADAVAQRPATGAPEVETARLALRSADSLDAAQLHDLREKVRTGYYDQPEVIGRVAEAAARDLSA